MTEWGVAIRRRVDRELHQSSASLLSLEEGLDPWWSPEPERSFAPPSRLWFWLRRGDWTEPKGSWVMTEQSEVRERLEEKFPLAWSVDEYLQNDGWTIVIQVSLVIRGGYPQNIPLIPKPRITSDHCFLPFMVFLALKKPLADYWEKNSADYFFLHNSESADSQNSEYQTQG